MDYQSESEPVLLSDLLLTLQREISRAREGTSLSSKGGHSSVILDDVNFRIECNFTPVNADGAGEDETIDALLVHAHGAHRMSLEGKVAVDVELAAPPSDQSTDETQKSVRKASS